jgi:hypothetical protein
MIMPGGRIRHRVYFSITHDEWPRVKAHLGGLLAAYAAVKTCIHPRVTPIARRQDAAMPA